MSGGFRQKRALSQPYRHQASGDIALGEFRAPERPGLYGLVAAAGDPEGTQGRVTSSAIKVLDCPRSSP